MMKELLDKRTPHSKTFDLGGGCFRLQVQKNLHFMKDGKLEEVKLTPREDRGHWLVDQAPYALRIHPRDPAYRYTSKNGSLSVELVDVGGQEPDVTRPGIEGCVSVWTEIARDTDYRIAPQNRGVSTWLILKSADAPRVWSWEVLGNAALLAPLVGQDARGQQCEIEVTHVGSQLVARWTGRVRSQAGLRRIGRPAWTDDAVFPVTIDPTVSDEELRNSGNDVRSSFFPGTPFINVANFQSYNYMGNSTAFGGELRVGLRFASLAIPQGTTINSATLTISRVKFGFGTNPAHIRIYADDVDDAAAWALGSGTRSVKNITRTTAFGAFTVANTVFASQVVDVRSVIQEIVDRAGWVSGNDMRFALEATDANAAAFIFDPPGQGDTQTLFIDYGAAATLRPGPGRGLTHSVLLSRRRLVS